MRPPTRSLVLLTRAVLVLAAAALILSTWAAPALAQSCYGESYVSYGGGACYSGSYSYATGPVYYGGPLATVGSRLAYRAFHPLAGVRSRLAARRVLAGTYGVGAACYSEGYAYGGGACYSTAYAAPVAPAHYHVAPMAYATPMAYAPVSYTAPVSYAASSYTAPVPYQPVEPRPCPPGMHWGGFTQSCVPDMRPRPTPSPQAPQSGAGAGTLHCPCGDAACNHMLGSCPCTDAGCKCHLPGPGTKVQRP
jgi:hypothetical protein